MALGTALTGLQALCGKLSEVQAHVAALLGGLGALGNMAWGEGQVADALKGTGTTEGVWLILGSKHETFHLHAAAYLTFMCCSFMEVLPQGGRAAPAHIHHILVSICTLAPCSTWKRRRVKLCGPISVQLLSGSALVQSAIK